MMRLMHAILSLTMLRYLILKRLTYEDGTYTPCLTNALSNKERREMESGGQAKSRGVMIEESRGKGAVDSLKTGCVDFSQYEYRRAPLSIGRDLAGWAEAR